VGSNGLCSLHRNFVNARAFWVKFWVGLADASTKVYAEFRRVKPDNDELLLVFIVNTLKCILNEQIRDIPNQYLLGKSLGRPTHARESSAGFCNFLSFTRIIPNHDPPPVSRTEEDAEIISALTFRLWLMPFKAREQTQCIHISRLVDGLDDQFRRATSLSPERQKQSLMVPPAPAGPVLVSDSGGASLCILVDAPTGAVSISLHRRGARPILTNVELRDLPVAVSAAPEKTTDGRLLLRLPHGATVEAQRHGSIDAFDVQVVAAADARSVQADFSLDDLGPTFGLGHLMMQHWPMQNGALELGPFYAFDNGPSGLCTLAVPTVISGSGFAIICDDTSPCLHLSLNAAGANVAARTPLKWGVGVANFDRQVLPRPASERKGDGLLTLQSRAAYDWPHVCHPWIVDAANTSVLRSPALKFTLGVADDARAATEGIVLRGLTDSTPSGRPMPPLRMMRDPIWTTWARFKDAVTQSDVLAFAEDIVARDLPRSVMEIDDRWSVKYGDLEFDKLKFPDPASMVTRLHELGFLVTLWVIPFANTDSHAVCEHETRGFFVKDTTGQVGEFNWWQPTRVAALDVTDDAACAWFVSRLHRLQSLYGLDGFKFDAGEPCFLPPGAAASGGTATSMQCPSDYSRAWIQKVAGKFDVAEVRCGVPGTENCAPVLRLFDRFSTWTVDNGLASVIPALLTASVLGYGLGCLPDMIGGNSYGDELPDAELMIRWAQATSAMPAMQFSIAPWDHGSDCEKLCTKALTWRAATFWPAIAKTFSDAAARFAPVARPMWWAARMSPDALSVADQFMVGDDLVVAPIVVEGARSRRVFLPDGNWARVKLEDGTAADPCAAPISGPCWLDSVDAPLDDMPTWRRVK
jgi:myogenesis-regulating glycosidase